MQARRGLVLGGGGVLGAAWMIGALSALEESIGADVRSFDYILGTSAGSVVAALLGSGVDVRSQRDHQLGRPIGGPLGAHDWNYDTIAGGSRPPRPRLSVGSPSMVARNVRRLRRMPPTAVLSALVPEGRGTMDGVGALIDIVTPRGDWAAHPGVWVVAMNYETGGGCPSAGRDHRLRGSPRR